MNSLYLTVILLCTNLSALCSETNLSSATSEVNKLITERILMSVNNENFIDKLSLKKILLKNKIKSKLEVSGDNFSSFPLSSTFDYSLTKITNVKRINYSSTIHSNLLRCIANLTPNSTIKSFNDFFIYGGNLENRNLIFFTNNKQTFAIEKDSIANNVIYTLEGTNIQFFIDSKSGLLNVETSNERADFKKEYVRHIKNIKDAYTILSLNINKSLFNEASYFKTNTNKFSYNVSKFHSQNNEYCTKEIVKIIPERSLGLRMNSLIGLNELQIDNLYRFLSIGTVNIQKGNFELPN